MRHAALHGARDIPSFGVAHGTMCGISMGYAARAPRYYARS